MPSPRFEPIPYGKADSAINRYTGWITMDFSRFTSGKTTKFRKKIIPWHYQKRYQESISEISLNLSVTSGKITNFFFVIFSLHLKFIY
ncbi:UNVERIFIED_CONTAM: hypothetical protein NCL1_16620 [Trichonephila clavipes]